MLTRPKWTKLPLCIFDFTPVNWRPVNLQFFFLFFFYFFQFLKLFTFFFKMETSEQHTGTDLVKFVYYPTGFI